MSMSSCGTCGASVIWRHRPGSAEKFMPPLDPASAATGIGISIDTGEVLGDTVVYQFHQCKAEDMERHILRQQARVSVQLQQAAASSIIKPEPTQDLDQQPEEEDTTSLYRGIETDDRYNGLILGEIEDETISLDTSEVVCIKCEAQPGYRCGSLQKGKNFGRACMNPHEARVVGALFRQHYVDGSETLRDAIEVWVAKTGNAGNFAKIEAKYNKED